ncbi:MAG: alpha/beta hydrolase [Cyanobacteria bacterium J06638_7]
MAEPGSPAAAATTARSAIHSLQRSHRLAQRGLVVVLLMVALWVSLSLGVLLPALNEVFDLADLRLLGRVTGILLLLLIPTAGIYSLIGQYAFWEGWLKDLPRPADLFPAAVAPAQAAAPAAAPSRFLVYLDGIHQVERDHPPRVLRLLDEIERGLDPHTVLMKGLESYTVLPVKLAEDRGSAWLWRRLFALQEEHPRPWIRFLAAFLVQANNVIKVGISSDRRYGPIASYLLALKIVHSLLPLGFVIGSHQQVVLLGYSGGGEMAMGVADYLQRLCRSPIRILTFCGVFSGNQQLARVEAIQMVVGSRDPVAAFGRLAYPGRLPLLPLSLWNQARRRGQVSRRRLVGMGHNGEHGPFSDRFRSALARCLLELIGSPPPRSPSPGLNQRS